MHRHGHFGSATKLPGDFVVPGATLLPLLRRAIGTNLGASCRVTRVLHQQVLEDLQPSGGLQVEYDFIDTHGSRRAVACRFLDRYGTLLARAYVEVDVLS